MRTKLVFIFFFFPYFSHAGEILTWKDCLQLAAQNNAELKSQEYVVNSSRAAVQAARSGYFPQLSADLSYNKSDINDPSYSAGLTASQNLFAGFQDVGKVEQAQANFKEAEAALDLTKAKISFDLKSAFEGLHFSKEYQTFTAGVTHRREENLNLVRLRFQSGQENKGSVLLSKAYLEQAHYEEMQSHHAVQSAQTTLQKELGLESFEGKDIQGEVTLSDPPTAPNFQELATATPDYRQAKSQESSAQSAITIAKSQFFPSLNLTASSGKIGPDFFPDSENHWSVGVGLSFPLFDGGKDYYGVQKSTALWSSAIAARQNLSHELLIKIQTAYTSFVETIAKLKVDQSFQQAATVRADIARNKYNNGLLSFDDWDKIESDLILRQKNYLQSKRDRIIAEAAWEQAQGKGAIP